MRESTAALSGAPRELWLCYFLKGLASFAYFSMSINLTIYLSEEFDYSDSQAGWLYGMWGVLISAYGVLSGPLIDRLGVRWSLALGAVIACVRRRILPRLRRPIPAQGLGLAAEARRRSPVTHALRAGPSAASCSPLPGLDGSRCSACPRLSPSARHWRCLSSRSPVRAPLPPPTCPSTDPFPGPAPVKRYTNHGNRTYAYGLFYTCMNVASLASGPITDGCVPAPAHPRWRGCRPLQGVDICTWALLASALPRTLANASCRPVSGPCFRRASRWGAPASPPFASSSSQARSRL